MSSQPPRRDYTNAEQSQSLVGRRARAFADRSREPGDSATWAIVLGALMCALLLICFSVSRATDYIWIPLLISFAWFVVVGRMGKVNIFSILWGSATTDRTTPPNDFWILQPTAALAAISLVIALVDLVRGWDYRWYGLALVLAALWFLNLYLRTVRH